VRALDEVKLHVSGATSPNALIFKFAKEKGFYKEEGLEVLPITAGMLPGIQGLVAGSFDFSQILGQGAGAILRGLPLKIVMAFDTRPMNWLYGGRHIKSPQDLKGGKQIAVSSFGAALDQMTREILPKYGIEPGRDVILRPIGNAPDRLAALLSGAVDASVLSHTDRIIARKSGFNELLFYGDHLEFVTGGVVASEKTLSQRADFVHRFLRGTLKRFYWWKSSESEVVSRLAKLLKGSEAESREVYQAGLKVFSADGTIPRSLQERMVTMQKKTLKVDRDVSPEEVYHFALVNSINKELGKVAH
jgi:ABC-type nitrate/sulfonate/bicarbonate transport system substrate-binding protein